MSGDEFIGGVEWFVSGEDAADSNLWTDDSDDATPVDGWDDPEKVADVEPLNFDSWVWIGRTGDEFRTREVVATSRLKYRYRAEVMKFGRFWRTDNPPLELTDSGEWWSDLTTGDVLYSVEDFMELERIRG